MALTNLKKGKEKLVDCRSKQSKQKRSISETPPISHLWTRNNITCPLINCVTDFNITDRTKESIWLQKVEMKSHKKSS